MRTITKNSNQVDGAVALFAVPCNNVSSINGFKISLIDTSWFYKLDCAFDSIDVQKELKKSKPGSSYQVTVSCFIPGTISTNEDLLHECAPYKFIVVYQNTDGAYMRIGSKNVGLEISYSHTTKGTIGYNVAFTGQITSPEYPCMPLYTIPIIAPKEYGCIYNIYAAFNVRGIAPTGYRVAMDTDWDALLSFVGPANIAGNKLKHPWQLNAPPPYGRSKHPRWNENHIQGSDDYGFSALPAGMYYALPKTVSLSDQYLPYEPYKYQIKYYGEKALFFSAVTEVAIGENRVYSREISYNSLALSRSLFVVSNDLISIRCVKTNPSGWQSGDTATDIDGNVYNTVKIGDQVWLASNLKTKRFNNGEAIPNVSQMTADNQPAFALIV